MARTFTQQELNSFLAQERREAAARYADYDDLKARAEQFDALVATAEGLAGEAGNYDEADAGEGGDADQGGGGQGEGAEGGAAAAQADAADVPDQPAPAPAVQHNNGGGDLAAENAQLRTQLLRQQIAAQRHLDPDLWDKVAGDTPDAIAADVAKLVAKVGAAPARPRGAYQSGAGVSEYRTPKERAAAAMRNMARSG